MSMNAPLPSARPAGFSSPCPPAASANAGTARTTSSAIKCRAIRMIHLVPAVAGLCEAGALHESETTGLCEAGYSVGSQEQAGEAEQNPDDPGPFDEGREEDHEAADRAGLLRLPGDAAERRV